MGSYCFFIFGLFSGKVVHIRRSESDHFSQLCSLIIFYFLLYSCLFPCLFHTIYLMIKKSGKQIFIEHILCPRQMGYLKVYTHFHLEQEKLGQAIKK